MGNVWGGKVDVYNESRYNDVRVQGIPASFDYAKPKYYQISRGHKETWNVTWFEHNFHVVVNHGGVQKEVKFVAKPGDVWHVVNGGVKNLADDKLYPWFK